MLTSLMPDQDLHVTPSEARMREDGHKARQQPRTTQTISILQHKELGQMYMGRLRFKGYPHQMNLRILQGNSAASTALRAFSPRMRRRQLRANLLYRITLSRLQFSNASLAHYAENTCILIRRFFQVAVDCRCLQVRKAFSAQHMRKTSECFPLES